MAIEIDPEILRKRAEELGLDLAKARRMAELGHAIQSGVAMSMNIGGSSTEPKHLRTGINNALCETSALTRLLVRKGVCTGEEAQDAIIECLEEEVARYEQQLQDHFGYVVTLL